ncbi:hypothetical protein JL720_6874 [Aureococcus anophagefferens]|nr:hypothetical protein JL720_6874 [Aureococcus anophagefferens]
MGASASVDQLQVIYSDVERAVPRTPRGSRDVEHCDRDGLTDVISRAEQDVKAFYDAAWESCAADDLLVATAALQDEFSPADPPRVRAEAMHAALEQPVKESGGAYYQGPRKGEDRIKEKAEDDYGGDVARVVDVERATGVYGTANDFNAAISKLRAAARGEELRILRCKDNLRGGTSGYRDVKLNVDVDGFVGELQLTFQSIKEIKDSGAHQVYEVSRVLAASGDDDALARALDGPDLESEQMLTLSRADGGSVMDACGSVALLEAALAKALPPGCCVANVYLWRSRARVRLGIDDVAAMAALRDEILLGSGFEEKLNGALPRWRRPATDAELPGLGFEKLVTTSGREFYVHETEAQFERPTVPVPASRRLATDEELPGPGYEELAAAQFERPTVRVPATRRLVTDEELPKYGFARFATSSGREFYVGSEFSKQASGNIRQGPVAHGWIMYEDEEGRAYYHHADSGKTTRDKPPGCIANVENEAQFARPTVPVPASRRPATDEELPGLGFERLVAASKFEVYMRKKASSERPRRIGPVAPGWIMYEDEEGRAYYHHADSGKTTMDKPPGCIANVENETQFARPTVPVQASRRPATDEQLPGLGFEKLVADGRYDVYVPANEAQFKRSDNGLAGSLGEEPTSVHVGVRCDGCDMDPIRGLRFKCTVRPNYDLCGRCDQRDTETHPKLKMPASRRLATDEELQGLGYEKDDLVDGREFYRDAKQELWERPLVTGDVVPLRCDRGAFLECYASSMMRFTKLTRHQREARRRARAQRRCPGAAGGGKTFVAIQRAHEVLHANQMVLFVSKNCALALFVVKWLVVASRTSAQRVADRVRVLVAPFERGPLEIRVEEADGRQRLAIGGRATSAMDGAGLVRSIANVPESAEVATVALEEVVRSTKRIVAGAAAFQLEAGRKAATRGHSASDGPPLEARLFDGDDVERYAQEVDAAIESVRRQLHGMDLDDRVAVVCPDADFCEERVALAAARAELRDRRRGDGEARRCRGRDECEGSPAWLVVDTVDNIDGLERLVVVCAGLDHAISVDDATALETRSRLYRAMTRAQLAVAVVNHRVPGGWLEFLGRLELGGAFDEERAKRDRAETAADDVVASCAADEGGDGVREVPDAGGDGVRAVPDAGGKGAVLEREEDSSAAERPAVGDGGGDVAETVERESPAAAAPKVNCVAVFPDGRRVVSGSGDKTVKVWDAATGECVATLAGHSDEVWCVAVFPDGRRVVSGSHDKTVKVNGVAVFPDGRRVVSGSSDKTVKVWSVAVFPDGRRVVSGSWDNMVKVIGVAVFPDGRRVVSGSVDQTVKVWDAATGECVRCVAVFPDGRRVVSGSEDHTVKLWGC